MKRLLLISTNQEKLPYPAAPLGLLYIANALKRAGFAVSILDLCFSRDIKGDIKKRIKLTNPDFIGVSIRNVDNLTFPQSLSYLPAIKEIIKIVKDQTKAPLILGGSAFSLFPEEILRFMNCQWGIIGEGERSLVDLLKCFNKKKADFKKVNNLVWNNQGKICCNRVKYLDDSFNHTLDYGLIDHQKYFHSAGMVNVQTKRGCGFECAYCTYPAIEGRGYRLRQPEIVAEEMQFLERKYSIRHVFLVDDVFTYPAEHAVLVCKALLKKKVRISWSCFASPYGISEKLLLLMKKAGCTHIEFGSDALSDRVLSKLHKPFTVKEIFRASRLCNQAKMKCAHYIIFGAPGENRASLQEGFTAIRKLNNDAIIIMIGIRIYPGTELEKMGLREGIISCQTDLLTPRFYLSPEIASDELLTKVREFTRGNSHCIVPGLGIRSSDEIFRVLRKHYHQGPLWGYL